MIPVLGKNDVQSGLLAELHEGGILEGHKAEKGTCRCGVWEDHWVGVTRMGGVGGVERRNNPIFFPFCSRVLFTKVLQVKGICSEETREKNLEHQK